MPIQYQPRLPPSLTPSELEALDKLRLDVSPPSDMARLLVALREGCDQHLSSRIVLALEDDTIVGWSAVELWKTRPTSPRTFTLLNVFVAPSYRNQGIGSCLARAAYGLKAEITAGPLYLADDLPGSDFYRHVLPPDAFALV